MVRLYGQIRSKNQLRGELKTSHTLQGKISIPSQYHGYAKYEGEYNVRPKINSQELPTANKVLVQNVSVEKIPIYEVSNEKGNTVVIGGEKEYGYQ